MLINQTALEHSPSPQGDREKGILTYLYHWSSPRTKCLLDLNAVLNIVGDLESHNPYMTDYRELQAMDTVGIGGEVVEGGN